ncbi:hypothetical protein RRG08_001000 [Elysia crispata]|uniref:Uncharacterized protein n=1 Tax=Elysia crispata TaxID=231223 RepID=A0AAE0XTW6_9GAST|nr:hypothetical protein RRG08_001000 [Elysia crispata]
MFWPGPSLGDLETIGPDLRPSAATEVVLGSVELGVTAVLLVATESKSFWKELSRLVFSRRGRWWGRRPPFRLYPCYDGVNRLYPCVMMV